MVKVGQDQHRARERTEKPAEKTDQSTLEDQPLEQLSVIGEFRQGRKPQPASFDGEGISLRDDQSGNEQSGPERLVPPQRTFEAEHDRHYCKDDH